MSEPGLQHLRMLRGRVAPHAMRHAHHFRVNAGDPLKRRRERVDHAPEQVAADAGAAAVGAWAAAARLLGRWNRYEIAAVTYAIFLVFSSGFGVQYAAIILPLLFAALAFRGLRCQQGPGDRGHPRRALHAFL